MVNPTNPQHLRNLKLRAFIKLGEDILSLFIESYEAKNPETEIETDTNSPLLARYAANATTVAVEATARRADGTRAAVQ